MCMLKYLFTNLRCKIGIRKFEENFPNLFLAITQVQISYSDHNLYEFEKYCNIAWDGDIGKVECDESVSYGVYLERNCEARWDMDEGVFYCRGSHFRSIKKRCNTDDRGNIKC